MQDINIIQVVINQHGPIFAELIELLTHSLQRLGFGVKHSKNQLDDKRLNLIVGATAFLKEQDFNIIKQSRNPYIVFQVEALDQQHGFIRHNPAYMDFLLSARQVWDYSPTNLSFLAGQGFTNVCYIPIGYSSRLERISHAEVRDIDVLFYGAIRPRRQRVLESLNARGARMRVMFNAYGAVRDQTIARSKIVLNLHQFEASQLEQIRIAYLLNNQCFVISETSDCNPYGNGVIFCEYERIADCCMFFLRPEMTHKRYRIAETGYTNLKAIPTAESISSALAHLTESPPHRKASGRPHPTLLATRPHLLAQLQKPSTL